MKVKVIDRRYRGCAVGCDQCHTCRVHDELSWALAQEKLIISQLLAAERLQESSWRASPQEEEDFWGNEMPF